jgi:hypothetical protein
LLQRLGYEKVDCLEKQMRVELTVDEKLSRVLHQTIMDFQVHFDKGEPVVKAQVDVLAHGAAQAWEIVHDQAWQGQRQ